MLFGGADCCSHVDVKAATDTKRDIDAPADTEWRLDPAYAIEIGGHRFYVGQPVVTRANDRRLTRGHDNEQWVRNGDRWTVLAGTKDEMYLEHRGTGDRQAIPAEYIEAGHVGVDYASTIHRAQGATVDEAHLLLSEHTAAKQIYLGATRGRAGNHVHAIPPTFEDDVHGPPQPVADWSPIDAVKAALQKPGSKTTALARRRQLRDESHTQARTLSKWMNAQRRPSTPRPSGGRGL